MGGPVRADAGVTSTGRVFEDAKIGAVYSDRPGRPITGTDNIWFTLLQMNRNTYPLRFDNACATHSKFGRESLNGSLTRSMVSRSSVHDVRQKSGGNLGCGDIKLTKTVFAGDTIHAQGAVVSELQSVGRCIREIGTVHSSRVQSDITVFMKFDRTVLPPKRGHGIEVRAN